MRHADDSPAQGRRSLSLPKAVGALFIAVIGSARGRWFPRFFPAVTGAPITSPPMRAIGVPHALTFATGGRKGFATQSGNALRCRPRSAARLFVLCVFRLNANPAFSVRANVSGNIQSARVSVIHRAVAVPPFWPMSAFSAPARWALSSSAERLKLSRLERATPEKHYANGTQRRPSPGSRQVEYVLQIAASAALFSSALNSTGKQITTSRLDPSNHLVEHVAAGHASNRFANNPQRVAETCPRHLAPRLFAGGPQTKTYQ